MNDLRASYPVLKSASPPSTSEVRPNNERLRIFIIHPSDLLTDHLPNGDGLVAHGFIRELAARGHQIYIAARSVDLSTPLPNNVKIFTLKRRFNLPLLDRFEYMVRARALFQTLNRKIHFDILHQMNPAFAGLSLAFVGCYAPVVLGTIVPRWTNDPDSLASKYRILSPIIEWVRQQIVAFQQQHASVLMLTSKAALNRVPRYKRVKHKIHFISHGIDSDIFCPPNHPMSPGQSPYILFLAGLFERKGIYVLLDAYAEVLKDLPNVRLIIAGDGPESEELSRRVRSLGARAKISLMGLTNRAAALNLMQNSTVFCLPSFGEPYATSIIEAMSCGRAIVATAAGGVPELLAPNGGILVAPRDARALAIALKRVIEDESLRLSMQKVNRKYVEDHLKWTSVVNRLEFIYSSAIEASRQSINRLKVPAMTSLSADEHSR